jgi:glutamate 5-kinase
LSTNLSSPKTLVIKIGTSLLTGERGFDGRVLENVVKELAQLKRERDVNILIVSSGAVGCGMGVLGLKAKPLLLPVKQATAAVGQSRLMHYYEVLFETYGDGLKVAQVLLTAADLDNRYSYLNIRNTIRALFDFKTVVPIVNENDSTATDELHGLRFGDNDTLAARVAAKIGADLLILLSDVDGLFDKNPVKHPDAKLLERVETVTDEIEAVAGGAGSVAATGGMKTKLQAARIAHSAGLPMVIANGRRPNVIRDVLAGTAPMTLFDAGNGGMSQRKRWIAFGRSTRGVIQIDDGARDALLNKGRSLLAAGVTNVVGSFEIGASVRIDDPLGHSIACGLVNYSSEDLKRIKGRKSREIESILGRKDFDEVIHRDNLVLL